MRKNLKFIFAVLPVFSVLSTSAQLSPSPDFPRMMVQKAKIATTSISDLNDPAKAHIRI